MSAEEKGCSTEEELEAVEFLAARGIHAGDHVLFDGVALAVHEGVASLEHGVMAVTRIDAEDEVLQLIHFSRLTRWGKKPHGQ